MTPTASCREYETAIVLLLTLEFHMQRRWSMAKMIIAGERVGAKSGKTIEVKDPATGEVVDTVPRADAADVDAAVEAAATAFPAWASTGGLQRGAVIQKAAEIIPQHVDEIATLLTPEQGIPLRNTNAPLGRG